MKCPKCDYLGFETGDRCKNCGYDFSLLAAHSFDAPVEPDITLRVEDFSDDSTDMWLKDLDRILPGPGIDVPLDPMDPREVDEPIEMRPKSAPLPADFTIDPIEPVDAIDSVDPLHDLPWAIVPPAPEITLNPPEERADTIEAAEPWPRIHPVEPPLPLFIPDDGDDTPLITMPSAPRPPLAVRRTPEVPRLRAVSRLRAVEPALDLREEPAERTEEPDVDVDSDADVSRSWDAAASPQSVAGRRVSAAAIDHVILLAIDLAVVYFTVRMAGLQASEWHLIPPMPMAIFLGMIAFAYFTAFTAVGGQTIGKMATGVRVVGEDRREVDGFAACRRTVAAVLSYVTIGLAYLPGLIGGDRRALHDRIAHTRVVAGPSA